MLAILVSGCPNDERDSDRPRSVFSWDLPLGFSPAYVATDTSGVNWGLFVSRRFSGKDNLWAVRSDGSGWEKPVCVMNAYVFDELRFEVRDSRLNLTFVNIDPGYYRDYDLKQPDTSSTPDTLRLRFDISGLEADADKDQLPDVVEAELLTSNRLPDSDADGKSDGVDYSPLGKPLPNEARFEIYRAAIVYLMHLDDPKNIEPREDTSWSAYYGVPYLHEPTVAYLSLPDEIAMPEFVDLPIILIEARAPLYFTAKQRYSSVSGGIVPHLLFRKPEFVMFEEMTSLLIEYVADKYRRESATLLFRKIDGSWSVEGVTAEP
jgi:hypothetical protein